MFRIAYTTCLQLNSCVLYLGSVKVQCLEDPEVRLPAGLELERANGVVDVLQRVDDAVRVVVRGVDAPVRASMRVRDVLDAVRHLCRQYVGSTTVNNDCPN